MTRQLRVAVVGAGSSGLAALRALSQVGLEVEGFERGSGVGGNWVFGNDNGWSAAYASLRTNVSRRRMQYPSFPMPRRFGWFPGHADMAAYMEDYARAAGLHRLIRFGVTVERAQREAGGWTLELDDGTSRRFDVLICATGCHRVPRWPEWVPARDRSVPVIHTHDYCQPEPFRDRTVLVVGGGNSAMEIGAEVSGLAKRTLLSVRSGTYVIPRLVHGRPYDELDVSPINRMSWSLLNAMLVRAGRLDRAQPPGLPRPGHRPLEQLPSVCSGLAEAVRSGAVEIRPAVDRLEQRGVAFRDGSREQVDAVICATGYRIDFPFLPDGLVPVDGHCVELYRRIVPPGVPGLFFVGLVDAPGGLLPVVEAQADWIARTLTGRLELPSPDAMRAAAAVPEKRTRERFPLEPPHSIRCDPHAYRRRLRSDRRAAPAAALRRSRLRCHPAPAQRGGIA